MTKHGKCTDSCDSYVCRGPRGHRGHRGPTGAVGPTGAAGPKGDTGAVGPTGATALSTQTLIFNSGPLAPTSDLGYIGNGFTQPSAGLVSSATFSTASLLAYDGVIENLYVSLFDLNTGGTVTNATVTIGVYSAQNGPIGSLFLNNVSSGHLTFPTGGYPFTAGNTISVNYLNQGALSTTGMIVGVGISKN